MLHIVQSKEVSDSYLIEWKRQNREGLRQLIPPDLDLAYKPKIEFEVGDPAEEILVLAETRNAELIVMGSHASTLSTHFPWTTSHRVLQKAHCPVLTVRAT
jgi:nucleotide-binding universal stress UspA family protein